MLARARHAPGIVLVALLVHDLLQEPGELGEPAEDLRGELLLAAGAAAARPAGGAQQGGGDRQRRGRHLRRRPAEAVFRINVDLECL